MSDPADPNMMTRSSSVLFDIVRGGLAALTDEATALRELERRMAYMHSQAWERERVIAGLRDDIDRMKAEGHDRREPMPREAFVIGEQESGMPYAEKQGILRRLGDVEAHLRQHVARIDRIEDRIGSLTARVFKLEGDGRRR